MNFKKIVSAVSALAISVSAFAGLAVTAQAALEETATVVRVRSWSADNKAGTQAVDDVNLKAVVGPSSSSTNYPGMGALQFSFANADNAEVKSAKLTYTFTIGKLGSAAHSVYSAETADADFSQVPVLSAEGVNGIYTNTASGTRWTYNSAVLGDLTKVETIATPSTLVSNDEVDVTDYVKAQAEAGTNYATFVFSDCIRGATITDYALNITYVDATVATYAATFVANNGDVTPSIKVYSDAAKTVEEDPEYLENGTYYYSAVAEGYEDYAGQFDITDANKEVTFDMTAKIPAGAVTVKYMNGADEIAGAAVPAVNVSGKYVGDTVTYSYPVYINVDGTWYVTTETSYSKTLALTANAQESTVEYAPVTDTVVAFVEAENATATKAAGASGFADNTSTGERFSSGVAKSIQSSNANSYYVATVNIPADGNYTFAGPLYNNNSKSRSVDIFVDGLPNGNDVPDYSKAVDANGTASFSIDKDLTAGEHTFVFAADGALSPVFDYVVVTQNSVVAPATPSVSATSAVKENYITFKGEISNVEDLTTVTKAGFGFINTDTLGADLKALWTVNEVTEGAFGAAVEKLEGTTSSAFYAIPYIVIGEDHVFGSAAPAALNN